MGIRKPAVAGRFYPGSEDRLRSSVEDLLFEQAERQAIAVVAPHAGYVYSGSTAGRVFGAIHVPDRVVVLSPNHTGRGARLSVWREGHWSTPLGNVPIDTELADALIAADPRFSADEAAHQTEHAIEVELPFLQLRNPNFRLTPIVISGTPRDTLVSVGHSLAKVIQSLKDDVLIVSSTDMSHYVSAEEARSLDRQALGCIESLDPGGLYDVVREREISMCGVMPTTVALSAAVMLGATKAEVVAYTNSGEVSGDSNQVVGYAGVIIE